MREEIKRKRTPLRIRNKIFLIILAFVITALACIWCFQAGFMEETYSLINRYQMDSLCRNIEQELTSTSLQEIADAYAANTGICVKVYRISADGTLTEEADCVEAFGCAIHNLTASEILFLYQQAEAGESNYYHRYLQILQEHPDENEKEDTDTPPKEDDKNDSETGDGEEEDPPEIPSESEMEQVSTDRLVLARITEGQEKYFILLDCALAPLDPIVRTIRLQLLLVTAVLFVVSITIAYIISYLIARPVVDLNDKAKELVKGTYDIDFTVGGYREVTELSETLNRASEELMRTDRLQKELIGNVSHDLRTPLTMIVGYGEMMRDVPSEMTPENMEVIVNEAKRLNGLVTDLLEISRYQAGNGANTPVIFDLTHAIEETVNSYRHLNAEGGYRFVWEAKESVEVYADRNRILRALCNLLNNAINFAGEDKVVEIRMTIAGGQVRVEVVDHGAGIPQGEQENIWDRYYRSDRTKGRRAGTGLGLSIVRHIMEANNATYGVESASGVGSCFWFSLPVASHAEESTEEA